MSILLRLALVLSTAIGLSSCSVPLNYVAPADELDAAFCGGSIKGMESYCVDSSFVSSGSVSYRALVRKGNLLSSANWVSGSVRLSASDQPALIVVTEPGSLSTLDNLWINAIRTAFPTAMVPYFRMIENNLLAAYFTHLFNTYGAKYGRIYWVRGQTDISNLFLGTLNRATLLHKRVDVFAAIHGAPGAWLLNPLLQPSLTATSLINYSTGQMTVDQRKHVGAFFNTACYNFLADSTKIRDSSGASMALATTLAFPNAVTYGGLGVNYGPTIRDFVAFERYYAGESFFKSVQRANVFVSYNLVNNQLRSAVHLPALQGRGCADLYLFDTCQTQNIKLGKFNLYDWMRSDILANLVVGSNYSGNNNLAYQNLAIGTALPL